MPRCGVKSIFVLAALLASGCVDNDPAEVRLCPEGSLKTAPGVCGCDAEDADADGDTVMDCIDKCPGDAKKSEPGICGCGTPDTDSDGDGTPDCKDLCPDDAQKTAPGICGCGTPDADSDGDGTPDCKDLCPDDPQKIAAGICGCGTADTPENIADTDGDGTPDCLDGCPENPYKTAPGNSTCDDRDTDGDGAEDAQDDCPYNPDIQKLKDGESCNLKTETDDDGNAVTVFEVWSAYDLVELRKYLGTKSYGLEMAFCDEGSPSVCSEEPDAGYICSDNMYRRVTCYGGCAVKDGAFECKQSKEATEKHEVGEDCSVWEDSYSVCTSEKTFTKCENKIVAEETCRNGEICKNAAENGGKTGCAKISATGNEVAAGGNPGDACDSFKYTETCKSETQMLTCADGIVSAKTCALCADFAGSAFCYEMPAPEHGLRVRLMNDVELADALPLAEKVTESCAANWTPLNLHRVDFDGQDHTIYLSKSRPECVLNNPLFFIVSDSRVANLNLSYDVAGKAAAVLFYYIYNTLAERISYTGSRRNGAQLFSEFDPSEGGTKNPFTLAFVSNHSYFGNIALDMPLLDTASIIYVSESTYFKDIDIKIKNYHYNGNANNDDIYAFGETHEAGIMQNFSLDIGNFSLSSDSKKFKDITIAGNFSMILNNFDINVSAFDFSHVSSVKSLRAGVFYSFANGMHITLGDIGSGSSDTKYAPEIDELSLIDFAILPFKDVTVKTGDLHAKSINLFNAQGCKIEDVTASVGKIYADTVKGFEIAGSDIKNADITLGDIAAGGDVNLFKIAASSLENFKVKGNNIAAKNYFSFAQDSDSEITFDSAELTVNNIKTSGEMNLFMPFAGQKTTLKNVVLSVASATSLESIWAFDVIQGAAIENSRFSVKDSAAAESIFFAYYADGAKMSDIAVRMDKIYAGDEAFMFGKFGGSSIAGGAFFADMQSTSDQTFPFIKTLAFGSPMSLKNIVTSGVHAQYTRENPEDLRDYADSKALSGGHAVGEVVAASGTLEIENVYWFKQTAEAMPIGASDAFDAALTVTGSFAPYAADGNAALGDIKKASEAVQSLGSGWELTEADIQGTKVKIPWLKAASQE